MVMVDGHAQMADVHDRMPLILAREDWATWQQASPEDALALCRTWPGDLVVDRSTELWSGKGHATGSLF
jgi:putative SOS response-associated peptidase YedK